MTCGDSPPLAVPIPEVARLLSLSERQVYYMLRSGALPSVRLGRRRLILVEDLRRILEESRVTTPDNPHNGL